MLSWQKFFRREAQQPLTSRGKMTDSGSKIGPWQSRRDTVVNNAHAAALLIALIFLAAWPWEMFQRVFGHLTLVLCASVFMLGFGLVRTLTLRPWRIGLPKGLGLPITVIALACLQSALHSADPAASKALLTKYAWYLALFGVAEPLFGRPGDAALAWRVFAVSAGLVGLCAVLCAAGWLTPALAGTHEYFGRRLTEDVRVGAFVRIAATTPDYNQAILPMLTALPFLLVWVASPAARRSGRIVSALLALFVVAGVAASFSRSGLLAVMALFAGGALIILGRWVITPLPERLEITVPEAPPSIPLRRGCREAAGDVDAANESEPTSPGRLSPTTPFKGGLRKGRLLLALAGLAVIVVGGLTLLYAGGYADMLLRRALRGFNSPDPSYRSRLYVFGLVFKLLPKYALFGCGIGASGAAIGAVAEPAKWMGTAIHSMPLMMWFETGILGLVGYCWLWWALVRRVWLGLVRSDEAERRALGFTTLGALAIVFWMTSVQPFQELSLFPVLAALIIGPACWSLRDGAPPALVASKRWCTAFIGAMLAVTVTVCGNIATYQGVAFDVSKYAAALENGLAAEQRGDWETARNNYGVAGNIALHHPKSRSIHALLPSFHWDKREWLNIFWDERERLSNAIYYDEAFHAADLEFIFLRLPGRGGPPAMPYQVAEFGVLRCLWNMGELEQASKALENCWVKVRGSVFISGICRSWPEAAFAAGEIHWQQGRQRHALGAWRDAARLNRMRKPFPPLEYPIDVAPSMDEIYQKLDVEAKSLADSTKPADIARRVALLLRLNRQEAAVSALQAAPGDAPELAVFREALKGR